MSSRGREGKICQVHTQARGCEAGTPAPSPDGPAGHGPAQRRAHCWSPLVLSRGLALSAWPQGPVQGPRAGVKVLPDQTPLRPEQPGPPQGPEGGEGDRKQPAREGRQAKAGRWGGSAGSSLDSQPRAPRQPPKVAEAEVGGEKLLLGQGQAAGGGRSPRPQGQAGIGHLGA